MELSLQNIIENGIKFVFERTTLTEKKTNTLEKLQSSNSENYGASSNSGDHGASSNSGYGGASSNSGNYGASMSVAVESSSETNAKESVAIATGFDCKVKGNLGSWIVVTERNNDWEILSIVSKKVDGKKIKSDIWYKNIGGKLVEV